MTSPARRSPPPRHRGGGGPARAGFNGILLVDKEQGWTSHDVVAKARGMTGQRKIGHTGTLDPMATGLLVLCLGNATRLVEYMAGHHKSYSGEIALGVTTDTDDAEGAVIASAAVPAIDGALLARLEARFSGEFLQRPPTYSAIKVAGQRAYAVARKGGVLTLEPRPVVVDGISLRPAGEARIAIDVSCGAGTYVRSIARDIGEALGCGGHLAGLRRLRSGGFTVERALTIDELQRVSDAGRIREWLFGPDEGVSAWEAAIVDTRHLGQLRNGSAYRAAAAGNGAERLVRVYGTDGAFFGAGGIDPDGILRPVKRLEG